MSREYPARVDLPWDELDGRVFVALPRRRGAVERWIARHVVATPENVLITLEGHAAAFWRLADGTRDLATLARDFAAQTGDAERIDERIREFATRLAKRGLVRLLPSPQPVLETRVGLDEHQGFARHPCRHCRVRLPVRAPPGAFFLCPRCRRLNRLPRA